MANEVTTGGLTGAASGAMAGTQVMPGWGTLIGGVIGLGAGLFGGAKAAEKRNKAERQLRAREEEAKAWYNRNALNDYTQRQDAQLLLKNLRESQIRANRNTANNSVVTGSTPAATAAQKERDNATVSNVYANLGARGQQYKDWIENSYLNQRNNLYNLQQGMWNNQATSYENLMNNGLGTVGNIMGYAS
jgi:hypothetical protein